MLEDTLLLGDPTALAALFERTEAVVVGHPGEDPATALASLGYVASAHVARVGHGLAITVTSDLVVLSRRGSDRRWRLVAVVVTASRRRSSAGEVSGGSESCTSPLDDASELPEAGSVEGEVIHQR